MNGGNSPIHRITFESRSVRTERISSCCYYVSPVGLDRQTHPQGNNCTMKQDGDWDKCFQDLVSEGLGGWLQGDLVYRGHWVYQEGMFALRVSR